TTLTVLNSARVVREPEGAVRYYEGAIEDIGERRRLQELLHRAQRMKMIGRLAGGLAHDLNNMLTVILGNCQMLLTEFDSSDPRAAEISEIAEAGRRAASL
ncbi:MAG: hybrid sensor histidine kinase/response regulator, partial [Gemmatimonadetes bacterium]|nr:hybrid sensor histidine kinase/response regulator [Gemmatimonadota bacterium]NIS01277.1 hybrid sensor histidine kinase/response regulator [Gemmatimonadota bacterium]NIT67403.1 hybrid sensor histidine kinase/response regulator [Gemmatimonadota bacterium]NIV24122.1 hybrid sensor histidine kinase/response regulator [Gemmatimonadota bacterium]NIW75476.1 hybrid sensor histidine kinase/response regulator [Gemmatimonadota bacterium]